MTKAQAPSSRSIAPQPDEPMRPSATVIRLERRRAAAAKRVRRFDPARLPPRADGPATGPDLRPGWLVIAVLVLVVVAHASGLYVLSLTWVEPAMSLDTIDLQVVAAGDSPVDAPATPPQDATPPEPMVDPEPPKPEPVIEPQPETPKPEPVVEPPPPAPLPPPEPLPAPVEAPPPPVLAAPEAPIIPITPPEPKPADPVPPPPVEQIPPKPEPKPTPAPNPQPKPKPHPAKPATAAQKKGVETGKPVDAGASLAAYGALINAEANSHRFYPEAARQKGLTGRVTVTFTIGRAGTATSVSITQSSGHAELDDAARQAIRAIHAAPPPGGTFTASKSFTYALH